MGHLVQGNKLQKVIYTLLVKHFELVKRSLKCVNVKVNTNVSQSPITK